MDSQLSAERILSMALIKPVPPKRVVQAFKSGLADFIDPDDGLRGVFLDAHPARHDAHHVYSLGVGDINEDGTMKKQPRPVGWRFFAADEASNLAGACHIGESLGVAPRVTGLSRATKLADVFTLSHQFERLDEVLQKERSGKDYDLLALRIPGLLEAFWLKSRSSSPAEDLVVPFYTRIREWDLNPPPPEAEATARQPKQLKALRMEDFLKKVYQETKARRNAEAAYPSAILTSSSS